jgi:hypothetical protein
MRIAIGARQMTRRLLVASLSLATWVVAPDALARSTFDPDAGRVRLPKDAVRTFDFETPESLVGLELGAWDNTSGQLPLLRRTPIANPGDVAALLTQGDDDVLEGTHAIRLGANQTGIVIRDAALFDQLKGGRFEVNLWARADGTTPGIWVVYDQDPEGIFGPNWSFATVRAIRTGRQTSDGWAEISTGALDGNIWGAPVRAIALLPSSAADAPDTFLVDALDIQKVDGQPTPPIACTQQTVDTVCGAEGDCIFGHCVSSTVTWGLLPPAAHRSEIAERWIMYGTRVIGDRNAAKHGVDIMTPQARALAVTAPSSRQFYGGLNRLVNLLRDNHTSFGFPANVTDFTPQVDFGSSSALGACFGVVEKDIAGGGLGFAVYRAVTDTPLSGVKLQRGDLLYAIDGRDPKEWIDDVWPRFATTMPNDPASDWSSVAGSLARLIVTRGQTATFMRCASASACDAANRQLITVDVSRAIFEAVANPNPNAPQGQRLGCSQRFTESVSGTAGGFNGEDPVKTTTNANGDVLVSFDGFNTITGGGSKWVAAMQGVFNPHPARVVMDARMGHGGNLEAVTELLDLMRGTSEPTGVFTFGRGTYDLTDPPWLFERLKGCVVTSRDFWTCFEANAIASFTTAASPPGGGTKIAWLNANDVSANDFMPRLLQGRSNLKIFSPHPTAGAFGNIIELPSVQTNWGGGSIQIADSRFAPDAQTAIGARWESGHGVVPDVAVAQKLSDAILGVDTILTTALAWLEAP